MIPSPSLEELWLPVSSAAVLDVSSPDRPTMKKIFLFFSFNLKQCFFSLSCQQFHS